MSAIRVSKMFAFQGVKYSSVNGILFDLHTVCNSIHVDVCISRVSGVRGSTVYLSITKQIP